MDEAVKQATLLLEALTAQIGTTVEQLWPFMVTSVRAQWIGSMVVGVILLAIGLIALREVIRLLNSDIPTIINAHTGVKEIDGSFTLKTGIFVVIATTCILIGGITTGSRLSHLEDLIVPEAQAADNLIRAVTGKQITEGGCGCP